MMSNQDNLQKKIKDISDKFLQKYQKSYKELADERNKLNDSRYNKFAQSIIKAGQNYK